MPTAHLNGIDVHYETHGSGTPLVLAHGYTASLEMWREQVDAFSAAHRLVIYDTRGHGGTSAPADAAAYTLDRHYAPDLLALLDHLGIRRAYIGGLSMGGMIAQEFALQHPQRVGALLLFDTGPGMGMMRRNPELAQRFAAFRAAMQTLARTQGMAAVIDGAMRGPMAQAAMAGGRGPLPAAVQRHIEGMKKMSIDGYLGGAAAMQAWAGSVERLGFVTAPALVLVGENDPLLGASRDMHARIRNSRLVVLRNAGHGTNMWRPREFTAATLAFLADVESGRPTGGEQVIG